DAGDVRWIAGRRGVAAPTLQQVGAVQRRAFHSNQNFLLARSRSLDLAQFQHLRPAGAGDYDGLHRIRSFARFLIQMGVPVKPKALRIWFSRKRWYEKCSFTARSVKRMKVGGATWAWVM